MKRTIVWPDLQCPYEDAHVVRNFELFAKAFKHDSVVTIGDEIDLPQISRWTENTPGWYEQTLADDRDHTVDVLWRLTQYAKEAHTIRSNHTDRLYNVIMKKIPAIDIFVRTQIKHIVHPLLLLVRARLPGRQLHLHRNQRGLGFLGFG